MRLLLSTASGPHLVEAEVARTPRERAVGLMHRRSVLQNRGMLLVYDPPQETAVWMKDTLVPLDAVFLRADGVVHRIESWTTPGDLRLIPSRGPVAAVLELAGGEAERMGLRVGDRVYRA